MTLVLHHHQRHTFARSAGKVNHALVGHAFLKKRGSLGFSAASFKDKAKYKAILSRIVKCACDSQ